MNSRFFTKEKVNAGRQPELDLLKAICIFCMVFGHVLLDLGRNGLPEADSDYIGVLFGAHTFMICMGISMCYMRRQEPRVYLMRGIGLLTIGQFLNLVRNAIPNLIAWWLTGKQFFIANSLLILQSDILSFAGLAFLLMALLKKGKLKHGAILGVGVLLSVAALVIWHTVPYPENYLASQLAAYFVITDAEAYFPLFSYFVFVAFGYFVGTYYPRIRDKNALANRVMAVCFPVAAVYYVYRFTRDISWLPEVGSDLQYNLSPTPDALAACLFTLGILAVFAKLMRLTGGKLPRIAEHFSTYINNYYCLHYLFILPVQTVMIAVTGHLFTSDMFLYIYGLLVVTACYGIIELNERYWHIHFATLKGKQMAAFFAVVWAATVAVTAYAYPRIEVFANVWNDYLLP